MTLKKINIVSKNDRIFIFERLVTKIGIVTGAGGDWLREAVEKELDVFITGEGKARIYHEAKELGMNVILAGHYATETFGVFSLEKIVSEWGVKTTYISRPTGL